MTKEVYAQHKHIRLGYCCASVLNDCQLEMMEIRGAGYQILMISGEKRER
jgi:hypothetical protein